jgi:hypothetical protein
MSINYPYKRMALENTTLQEQLIKEALRRRMRCELGVDKYCSSAKNLRNHHFIETLIANWDEIFKSLDYDTTRVLEADCDKIVHYIGDGDVWDYEVVLFNKKLYFICDTLDRCEEKLIEDVQENPEKLFTLSSLYVCGFIKEENSQVEVEYSEPDPKIDNVPLFDVNECPCCMGEWGATEISVFVGNKRIKPCVIKRYTHCGHPLCMKCFEKCCEDDDPTCPLCRAKYEETGDLRKIETHSNINSKAAQDLFQLQDPRLIDLVELDAIIHQSVISYGLAHLFSCEGFVKEGSGYFFGTEG